MNRSSSPGGTSTNGPSKPENEDDDPVGDNKPVEEAPEGSDAPSRDPVNDHRAEDEWHGRAERQPSPDSKLPQSSRG
jgi:hypothetical protein